MSNLLGIWLFTSLFYQGQIIPPPNPNLKLYYFFESQSRNQIYYYRENESGHCRRWANYSLTMSADQTGVITQKINELDPDNHMSCGQDPDMQLNVESKTQFHIDQDGKLHLHLALGDEPIEYIFTHIE